MRQIFTYAPTPTPHTISYLHYLHHTNVRCVRSDNAA